MLNIRIILISILLLVLTSPSYLEQIQKSQTTTSFEAKTFDKRAKILSDYFSSHNSPLKHQAQDFVDAADKYGVDWKLVPAIAGVESTFGQYNATPYNAWGWGVYGSSAIYFKSWKDGIFTVTEGLKKNYIDQGLTDPYSMNRVYATSPSWGWKVAYFIKDLENFTGAGNIKIKAPNYLAKTAASSAVLRYNQ